MDRSKRNKLLEYSQLAANISQILLVCLAAFGYFYTVIPVYQNQRFAEENARLQSEKDKIIKSIVEQEELYNQKIEEKTTELKKINVDLQNKANQLGRENKKLQQIQIESKEQIERENAELAKIERRLFLIVYKSELSRYCGSRLGKIFSLSLSRNSIRSQLDILTKEKIDEFIESIYLQPYDLVVNGISQLVNTYKNKQEPGFEEFINTSEKVLEYIHSRKDRYTISKSQLLPIKIHLRDFIDKRDELRNREDQIKDIKEKHDVSIQIIELVSQTDRDFLEFSDNYIDSPEIINDVIEYLKEGE